MSDKPAGAEKKIAAGICGILLGALGIHKFILGYTKQGVIMLLVSILTLGFLAWIMGIIGIIEGIIYLTKSDEEFARIYVQGRKGWF
jgi:TM2 domain-containing membrane protein YozV